MDQIQTKLDKNVYQLSTVVFTVNISTFGYCIVRKAAVLCLQCMVRLKFGAGFVIHWRWVVDKCNVIIHRLRNFVNVSLQNTFMYALLHYVGKNVARTPITASESFGMPLCVHSMLYHTFCFLLWKHVKQTFGQWP